MKKLTIKSIVVLSVICLCTSLLLAVTNQITAPIISESEREAIARSLEEIMPGSGEFEELDVSELGIDHLEAAWKCGGGYVMKLSASGYAPGIVIMCGISNEGEITGVKTLSCNETAGYGKQCEEDWFTSQFLHQGPTLDGVDGISGATKTSNAYFSAIASAFETFDTLRQGGAEHE